MNTKEMMGYQNGMMMAYTEWLNGEETFFQELIDIIQRHRAEMDLDALFQIRMGYYEMSQILLAGLQEGQ